MSIESMRDDLVRVWTYQDGRYYVGGFAKAEALGLIGCEGSLIDANWEALVANARPKEVEAAHEYLSCYIDHMNKNPVAPCPCCGQMRRV